MDFNTLAKVRISILEDMLDFKLDGIENSMSEEEKESLELDVVFLKTFIDRLNGRINGDKVTLNNPEDVRKLIYEYNRLIMLLQEHLSFAMEAATPLYHNESRVEDFDNVAHLMTWIELWIYELKDFIQDIMKKIMEQVKQDSEPKEDETATE